MGDNEKDEIDAILKALRKLKAAQKNHKKKLRDLVHDAEQEDKAAERDAENGHIDSALRHMKKGRTLWREALDLAVKDDDVAEAQKELDRAMKEYLEGD